MHYHIFALFLQTVNAIEKLLACCNVQPRIVVFPDHTHFLV